MHSLPRRLLKGLIFMPSDDKNRIDSFPRLPPQAEFNVQREHSIAASVYPKGYYPLTWSSDDCQKFDLDPFLQKKMIHSSRP